MTGLNPALVLAALGLALAACTGDIGVTKDPTPRIYDEAYLVDGICFKDTKGGRPYRVAPENCGA